MGRSETGRTCGRPADGGLTRYASRATRFCGERALSDLRFHISDLRWSSLCLCGYESIMQNKANFPEGKLTQDQQLERFMEIVPGAGAEKTNPICRPSAGKPKHLCFRRGKLPPVKTAIPKPKQARLQIRVHPRNPRYDFAKQTQFVGDKISVKPVITVAYGGCGRRRRRKNKAKRSQFEPSGRGLRDFNCRGFFRPFLDLHPSRIGFR